MTEIRNLLHRSKGGLDGAGERISELENRLVGSTQIQAQTEKKKKMGNI